MKLTERQKIILVLAAQGEKSEVIAIRLGISERLVHSEIANIKMAMGAKTKCDILRKLLDPNGTRLEQAIKEVA